MKQINLASSICGARKSIDQGILAPAKHKTQQKLAEAEKNKQLLENEAEQQPEQPAQSEEVAEANETANTEVSESDEDINDNEQTTSTAPAASDEDNPGENIPNKDTKESRA